MISVERVRELARELRRREAYMKACAASELASDNRMNSVCSAGGSVAFGKAAELVEQLLKESKEP